MRQAIAFVLLCAAMAAGQMMPTNLAPTAKMCLKSDGTNVGAKWITCPEPPPRSVPAVRKTRSSCSVVGTFTNTAVPTSCHDEQYWTCDDPSIPGGADRALLVSENQKKAMCLLVE